MTDEFVRVSGLMRCERSEYYCAAVFALTAREAVKEGFDKIAANKKLQDVFKMALSDPDNTLREEFINNCCILLNSKHSKNLTDDTLARFIRGVSDQTNLSFGVVRFKANSEILDFLESDNNKDFHTPLVRAALRHAASHELWFYDRVMFVPRANRAIASIPWRPYKVNETGIPLIPRV